MIAFTLFTMRVILLLDDPIFQRTKLRLSESR